MTDRQHLRHRPARGRSRGAPPPPPVVVLGRGQTAPVPAAPVEDSGILGFPAEYATGDQPPVPVPRLAEGAAAGVRLVVVRRSEPIGGLALLLAGAAADVSLWVPWWQGSEVTGVALARQVVTTLRSGLGALGRSGLWQPAVVVLGGGLLFLLGLLLFRRARSHRPAGLLALLVASAAMAGVVVPVANTGWSIRSFGPGMWCAVAVVLLGELGALKAMLTAPRIDVAVD